MHNKLLVICGATATGKTELGFYLAKIFNGELISADSRMVYKYMDIGTGKDIEKAPPGFAVEKIWGYDLVNPNEEFSISQYSRFARQKIQEIQERNKLPILVGGSGLYIKSVIDEIDTVQVPPDKNLRSTYAKANNTRGASADELFKILIKMDARKAQAMNNSDRNNPRRLIRAIEIAGQMKGAKLKVKKNDYDLLMIGLTADKDELKKRIEKRVDERIKNGFEKEIEFLKKNGFWDGAPSRTLGYKDWPDINKWKVEEFKYAKRQIVWFKKDLRIKWFDVTENDSLKEMEKLVKKWYAKAK